MQISKLASIIILKSYVQIQGPTKIVKARSEW